MRKMPEYLGLHRRTADLTQILLSLMQSRWSVGFTVLRCKIVWTLPPGKGETKLEKGKTKFFHRIKAKLLWHRTYSHGVRSREPGVQQRGWRSKKLQSDFRWSLPLYLYPPGGGGGGVLCAQRNNRSRQFDETAAVRGRVDERRHRSILLLSPRASYCGYVWVKAAAISALCSEWLMSELRAVIRKCGQAPGVVATVDMSREISPLELLTCLLPAHWGRTRRDEILWIKGPQFR